MRVLCVLSLVMTTAGPSTAVYTLTPQLVSSGTQRRELVQHTCVQEHYSLKDT